MGVCAVKALWHVHVARDSHVEFEVPSYLHIQMDKPEVLDQLLPSGFEQGMAEPMRAQQRGGGGDDNWQMHGDKQDRRDSLWKKWLFKPVEEGVQRSDDNIWTWPIGERKRKAHECAQPYMLVVQLQNTGRQKCCLAQLRTIRGHVQDTVFIMQCAHDLCVASIPHYNTCRWCKAAKLEEAQALMGHWSELEAAVAEKRKLLDVVQMRHLAQGMHVIGCTTSGAAKYRCAYSMVVLPRARQ